MCELCLEHIEAQLIGQWLISFWRNKLEAGARIDEATDEPCARHAINVNSLAGNPSFPLKILSARDCGAHDLFAQSLVTHTCFNSRNESLRCLAARRSEKVDGNKLSKAPFKPGKIDLALCTARLLNLPVRQRHLGKAASLLGDLVIFRAAGRLEQSLHLIIRETFDETRFAQRCVSTSFNDLPQHPLKVLLCLIVPKQDIHRVLDSDGAKALKPAPDLYSKVIWLRRKLMDKE